MDSSPTYTTNLVVYLPVQFTDIYLDIGKDYGKKNTSSPKIEKYETDYKYTWEGISLTDSVTFLSVRRPNSNTSQLSHLYLIGIWVPGGNPGPVGEISIDPFSTAQALCLLDWHLRSNDASTASQIISSYLEYKDGAPLTDLLVKLSELIYNAIKDNAGNNAPGWCSTTTSQDPQGKSHSRYALSSDTKAALIDVLGPAVKLIQNDLSLQDRKWVHHYGQPIIHRAPPPTSDPVRMSGAMTLSIGSSAASDGDTVAFDGFTYRIDPADPGHGLTIYPQSLAVDGDGQLSIEVNNKLMRYYSVYVVFYDDDDKLIEKPQLNGQPYPDWEVLQYLGLYLDRFQSQSDHPGEKLIDVVSSVWTIEGVPVPVNKTTIAFAWADAAASVTLRFGSLGQLQGDASEQVWVMGAIVTLVMNYLIPLSFMAVSARLDTTKILQDIIKARKTLAALIFAAAGLLTGSMIKLGPVQVLKALGEQAASLLAPILRTEALEALAAYINSKMAETEAEDGIPFVGEAIMIASELIDFANIAETTVDVAINPAIIEVKIKRVFHLTLALTAPSYGTYDRWPDEAATYRAVVKFDHQSTTFTQNGTFPDDVKNASEKPFIVQIDALPGGGMFTVEVGLYGGDDLCCATYATPQPLPAQDQSIEGHFTHINHPLDAKTRYEHERALTYDNGQYDLTLSPPTLIGTWMSLGTKSGQDFNRLGHIVFDAWNDLIGYSWEPADIAPGRSRSFVIFLIRFTIVSAVSRSTPA